MAKRKAAGQTIYDLLKGEFENLTIVLTQADTDHVEWSELLKQFSEAGQRVVLVEGKREGDFFRVPHHGREVGRAFEDIVAGLQPKALQPEISAGMVIVPDRPVTEGVLVQSTSLYWTAIVEELKGDWARAYSIPPRVWEEVVAGAYKKAGFDEVILTPRAGDHGRDIIALRKGIGSIRILGSVKAYRPGHLITKEEVHALMGVVSLDPNASKGIFTTTSDFAPRLLDDERLAKAIPHRIELMNGVRLREWLLQLAKVKG